jgi:hypothetical protein
VHVFDSVQSDSSAPGVLFRHKPGKPAAVLVVSGNYVSLHFLWASCRDFMRGVPVLASDSGYYPRSGMLPLARSSRHSNLRPQLAEIMPGILWLQRMVIHYSIEPCRITSRDLKKNCCRLSWGEPPNIKHIRKLFSAARFGAMKPFNLLMK